MVIGWPKFVDLFVGWGGGGKKWFVNTQACWDLFKKFINGEINFVRNTALSVVLKCAECLPEPDGIIIFTITQLLSVKFVKTKRI